MRYISLANALHERGHTVTIAGRSFDKQNYPDYINFVRVNNLFKLVTAFIKSDCIILHGGGVLLLFMSVFSGLVGKKIILDNYVPHWIEMDEVVSRSKFSFKLLAISCFNSFRSLLAVLVFNLVIVANKRQVDLLRGFLAPFSQTKEFNRIKQISFGCDVYKDRSRDNAIELLNMVSPEHVKFERSDFLIGWLGGVYDWFDLNSVMESVSEAFMQNPKIKIVFFGVSDDEKNVMLSKVSTERHKNFYFLPRVNFDKRFDYWSAFDVSLVWGAEGFENDYASRTRNFDCLSIGLPIIQNYDDEWGERIIKNDCGMVADIGNLTEKLLELSRDKDRVKQMQVAMINLSAEFNWSKFANELMVAVDDSKMSFFRRSVGLLSLLFVLPVAGLFFVYNLTIGFAKS